MGAQVIDGARAFARSAVVTLIEFARPRGRRPALVRQDPAGV